MRATSGRPLGVLAWTIVVTGALAGLLISGHGTLAGPPLAAPADWRAWATDREPQEALVALLRLAALGLSWYLVATTLANLVARAIGARLLVRLVDSLTLPVLRPVLHGVLGASIAASTVVVGASSAAAGSAPPAITMTRLRESPDPTPGPGIPTPEPSQAATWEVTPGDTFWQIARRVVTHALGRQPTEREIASYWRVLIDTNRDALRHRHNPNLVFPGQVFRLPNVSAGAAPPRSPAVGPQE